MQNSFTAIVERNQDFAADFCTEPYEAGWAAEARWFVDVSTLSGDDARLTLTTQLSPDGLTWCDAEDAVRRCERTGMITWPVHTFGQWLRLRGSFGGTDAAATMTVYLSLKG